MLLWNGYGPFHLFCLLAFMGETWWCLTLMTSQRILSKRICSLLLQMSRWLFAAKWQISSLHCCNTSMNKYKLQTAASQLMQRNQNKTQYKIQLQQCYTRYLNCRFSGSWPRFTQMPMQQCLAQTQTGVVATLLIKRELWMGLSGTAYKEVSMIKIHYRLLI